MSVQPSYQDLYLMVINAQQKLEHVIGLYNMQVIENHELKLQIDKLEEEVTDLAAKNLSLRSEIAELNNGLYFDL